jgi:hypothetical protein
MMDNVCEVFVYKQQIFGNHNADQRSRISSLETKTTKRPNKSKFKQRAWVYSTRTVCSTHQIQTRLTAIKGLRGGTLTKIIYPTTTSFQCSMRAHIFQPGRTHSKLGRTKMDSSCELFGPVVSGDIQRSAREQPVLTPPVHHPPSRPSTPACLPPAKFRAKIHRGLFWYSP